ncbi:hypothetical protein LTR78_002559 [Recurvomyces mirabilis]|uniref:Molybdenum cofactor sulfurase n=1 Tax=Recurvomyces mirabilis TaxID=574656 RepID=A0AAE0WTX8_9PEZI|nr:hypothetical protein LTR78_002559 [Recurvomyces mirabilis]KAK5157488.1 hypothetical protein LTS14_004253 [Recurvomyces mirabilis]
MGDNTIYSFSDLPIDANLGEYDIYIERMRTIQYPMLKDSLYLDHAGTTLYPKSLLDRFHQDMVSSLLANPHSASPSSRNATEMVDSVRLEALRYFRADPLHFDLIFVANATAGIKLVAEAMREQEGGFRYAYHVDSHTSAVGAREHAVHHKRARESLYGRTYTLLDAAAFVSTSALDLSDASSAPDFTTLSFNKIFGFPDLGALIVRKNAAHLFDRRRYFGGGTVEMVVCLKEQWHAKKAGPLHERLEDGTLPIHSILALKSAIETHWNLYGSQDRVAKHTLDLANRLYEGLAALQHGTGEHVCTIYKHPESSYDEPCTQGPTVAFNIKDSKGTWVSTSEVEKLAVIKDIHLRTGGVCNPGGVTQALGLEPWEMKENFSAGQRCGGEDDIRNGKPTGVVRLSLGAMSTRSDVERFLVFMDEFFVDRNSTMREWSSTAAGPTPTWHVESLTVYPVKSCGGWQIPDNMRWEVRREGLAWDREWCIVHQITGKVLSQKQYPRMALIRPVLDFKAGQLCLSGPGAKQKITVPLSQDPSYLEALDLSHIDTIVCGDPIKARSYSSSVIADFLSGVLDVPCTLARFPGSSGTAASTRHSKAHLQTGVRSTSIPRPIRLSNESPILTISRSSLNRLNEQIKAKGGKAAHQSAFRANIILSERPASLSINESPWAEDYWSGMKVGSEDGPVLDFLEGCRRCQMVCIDQISGERNQEPFVTLAKTRRFGGRVLFGVHTALASGSKSNMIRSGDVVEVHS